jgi:hypothetical protein
MALTIPTPFFQIAWTPAINVGRLPMCSGQQAPVFMTLRWQARMGAAYYPFEQYAAQDAGVAIQPKTASPTG